MTQILGQPCEFQVGGGPDLDAMWRTVERRSESAHAQLVQKLRDCEPAAAYAAAAGGADGGVQTRCTDGSDEPWAVI